MITLVLKKLDKGYCVMIGLAIFTLILGITLNEPRENAEEYKIQLVDTSEREYKFLELAMDSQVDSINANQIAVVTSVSLIDPVYVDGLDGVPADTGEEIGIEEYNENTGECAKLYYFDDLLIKSYISDNAMQTIVAKYISDGGTTIHLCELGVLPALVDTGIYTESNLYKELNTYITEVIQSGKGSVTMAPLLSEISNMENVEVATILLGMDGPEFGWNIDDSNIAFIQLRSKTEPVNMICHLTNGKISSIDII